MATGRLAERKHGLVVIDQYGQTWDVVADDMNGRYAIQRDNEAAEFARDVEAEGDIYPRYNGHTFGVNCSEEFVVRGNGWFRNDD